MTKNLSCMAWPSGYAPLQKVQGKIRFVSPADPGSFNHMEAWRVGSMPRLSGADARKGCRSILGSIEALLACSSIKSSSKSNGKRRNQPYRKFAL